MRTFIALYLLISTPKQWGFYMSNRWIQTKKNILIFHFSSLSVNESVEGGGLAVVDLLLT